MILSSFANRSSQVLGSGSRIPGDTLYKRLLLHLTRGPDRPRNLEALPGSGGTCRGRCSVWHQAVVSLR